MSETQPLAVKKLSLDMENFRTLKQRDEVSAINALIAVEPDWFWGLMESLIDDGYLPTENVIVMTSGKSFIVKEGNRRIAAMKIIHGYVDRDEFELPVEIVEKIESLTSEWRKANATVPCTVYSASEEERVDKIVTLIHGKGDKAGRVKWSAVARARHNREKLGGAEPALDVLEKFLNSSKSITPDQAERWSGEFNLSVLDEAIKKLASRLGQKSGPDLAKNYPKIGKRGSLDDLIRDIGLAQIGFSKVRAPDFGTKYGFPPPAPAPAPAPAPSSSPSGSPQAAPTPSGQTGAPTPSPSPTPAPSPGKKGAHPVDDPKAVTTKLRGLRVKGQGREKVASLVSELRKLDLTKTPHAFCFVLRSAFEISAKAYCQDHATVGGPKAVDANGKDRKLVEVLKGVVSHLTNNNSDAVKTRELHGAITELAKPDGILSVTSLNQLIHNPTFSVSPQDICILFGNVFPLLQAMNR